jgi:hypothetical protein
MWGTPYGYYEPTLLFWTLFFVVKNLPVPKRVQVHAKSIGKGWE